MQTQDQIIDAGRELIASAGYNGFSYSDVSRRVGVRNASVHHYFPAKSDLALAVVRESRTQMEAHAQKLAQAGVSPLEQIRGYLTFWKKCIADGSASFCVAGMLASELPTLPKVLADEVQAHFAMLIGWFEELLTVGRTAGDVVFDGEPRAQAEQLVATVYGAMLSARAMSNPSMFGIIVDQAFARLQGDTKPSAGAPR